MPEYGEWGRIRNLPVIPLPSPWAGKYLNHMVKPNSLSKQSKPSIGKAHKRTAKPAKTGPRPPADPHGVETQARPASPDSDPAPENAANAANAPGDTETRILSAARREFIAKGQDGARMQIIADQAGVNKALLHYYYRSKDNLYRKVLEVTLATVWGRVKAEFDSQMNSHVNSQINPEKAPQSPRPHGTSAEGGASLAGLHGLGVEAIVKTFVSTFIRTLAANRDFPLFVFREIAGGGATFPVVLQELLKHFQDIPVALIKALQEEAKAGLIRPVHPLHFLMNMMGMTVTTFLAIPMLHRLGPAAGFGFEPDDAFFEARIHSIADTLLNGIRIRK